LTLHETPYTEIVHMQSLSFKDRPGYPSHFSNSETLSASIIREILGMSSCTLCPQTIMQLLLLADQWSSVGSV